MPERTERPEINEPTVGEYKGSPTLSLPVGDGRGFTFGLRKARVIVEHFAAVQAFVTKHDNAGVKE